MRSTLRWDWGDVLAGGRIVTGETRELELEAATLLIGQQQARLVSATRCSCVPTSITGHRGRRPGL